ncbi:MAG TPA: VOC family protein, partial [Gammaproteobacteria bacterium]|nr:VOC family protein [Gammaproteobacteria bacterium]
MKTPLPGFGQPVGGIFQIAYVVADIDAALAHWTQQLRVGPFFVFPGFTLERLEYRGRPSHLDITLACGYSGSLCIELIAQHDDAPSVYRDVATERGYGFHHCGVITDAFDEDLARLQESGAALAMSGVAPGNGARVVYLDTRGPLPGMTELIERNPAVDALFT